MWKIITTAHCCKHWRLSRFGSSSKAWTPSIILQLIQEEILKYIVRFSQLSFFPAEYSHSNTKLFPWVVENLKRCLWLAVNLKRYLGLAKRESPLLREFLCYLQWIQGHLTGGFTSHGQSKSHLPPLRGIGGIGNGNGNGKWIGIGSRQHED